GPGARRWAPPSTPGGRAGPASWPPAPRGRSCRSGGSTASRPWDPSSTRRWAPGSRGSPTRSRSPPRSAPPPTPRRATTRRSLPGRRCREEPISGADLGPTGQRPEVDADRQRPVGQAGADPGVVLPLQRDGKPPDVPEVDRRDVAAHAQDAVAVVGGEVELDEAAEAAGDGGVAAVALPQAEAAGRLGQVEHE